MGSGQNLRKRIASGLLPPGINTDGLPANTPNQPPQILQTGGSLSQQLPADARSCGPRAALKLMQNDAIDPRNPTTNIMLQKEDGIHEVSSLDFFSVMPRRVLHSNNGA